MYMMSSIDVRSAGDSDVVQQRDKLAKNANFWPEIQNICSFGTGFTVVSKTWNTEGLTCWKI